jgi:exo-1,4-beta-D-glucosaminidase
MVVSHRLHAVLGGGQHAVLIINGIVGQADVWVNGASVATRSTVQGAFAQYAFDVTGLMRPGINSLALEVHPNNPTQMFTLDDVDWSQIPPDNNTGIQFPIEVHLSSALSIGNSTSPRTMSRTCPARR